MSPLNYLANENKDSQLTEQSTGSQHDTKRSDQSKLANTLVHTNTCT